MSESTNSNESIDDSAKAPSNDEVDKDITETIPDLISPHDVIYSKKDADETDETGIKSENESKAIEKDSNVSVDEPNQ